MILHETDTTVIIATANSVNRKTGKSVQIWILDATMHPADSRRTGHDAQNQCSGCPFASNNGCYVSVNPLGAIWRKYQSGGYDYLQMGTPEWNEFFAGHYVRFGAYGNPSLLPLPMLESIANLARKTTGYFHDWHQMPPALAKAYGKFLMASVESHNAEFALNLGLRAFRVSDAKPSGKFIACPSDRMTCAECGLCDGNRRSHLRKFPSIWIRPHGYQTKKAREQSAALASV